jgi:hypothetical protein
MAASPRLPPLRNRDLHNVPYLSVLLLAAGGVAYSALQSSHWLRGVGVVGASLLMACIWRFLLSDAQAGYLAVRRRTFDTLTYLLLGAAIIAVGLLVQLHR